MAQEALFLAAPIALGVRGALVMVFLTLGDPDLELHNAPMVEIHHQRNKRHTLAVGRAPEVGKLLTADQKFTAAAFFVLELSCLFVGRNIAVHEPEFAVFHSRVAFGNIRAPLAELLHFRSLKHDPAFEIILDRVIIARAPILGDHLVVRIRFSIALCHDRQIITCAAKVESA